MEIVKLKTKNQVTIPADIVKMMHLHNEELFAVKIENNYIKLVPVDVRPRYTKQELMKMKKLVEKEKSKSQTMKSAAEFREYIDKL
ncbi:MAG: AbrB/MazE/SpoVT family DNA-binding domain-containing protein [Elusimicrobiota bacterium]|nr:AbrB/MazE/SpoVT family DNA-binding domain-containing protein [Elusimicrobiota bacterium]